MQSNAASAVATSNHSPWAAFAVTASVAVLTILDLVKINVVLTPIQETLGTTTTHTQLIVAGYVLAFGITLVPSGRLGDQWNRKAMFLIGLSIFAAASLGAALAPTANTLVVARIIQGLAAGVLMPQVLGMIQNLFPGPTRGQAFGIFGASIGLGTAFGPTVGGMFVGIFGPELGWRWTFGMNVPLALIIIPLAIWLLPGRQARDAKDRDLDLVGVLLMSVTVLFVMLPFVLTSGTDADSGLRWLFLIAGAISAAVFVWWEKRYVSQGRSPVLDFRLFNFASYRNGVIITTLWFAMMPTTFLIMTLFNQQALGHEAVVVGMITIPYAIISAIAAAIIGRFTARYATQLVIWGLALFVAALLGLAAVSQWVAAEHVPMAMAIALAMAGAGPGFVMAANQMRTLKYVPLEQAGVAGSFQQVGQRLGNAVGIAVGSAVFYSLSSSVKPVAAGHVVDSPAPEFLSAYHMALVVIIGFGLLALLFAVIDHRSHMRDQKRKQESAISESSL